MDKFFTTLRLVTVWSALAFAIAAAPKGAEGDRSHGDSDGHTHDPHEHGHDGHDHEHDGHGHGHEHHNCDDCDHGAALERVLLHWMTPDDDWGILGSTRSTRLVLAGSAFTVPVPPLTLASAFVLALFLPLLLVLRRRSRRRASRLP